jgi:predicted transcriptional regulator
MDESYTQYQAAQFRVALLLKQYKFGAASAAKYLGKSRGLVQSWMQIGNKHYLAKEKIKLKSFEKIVKNLRRVITQENMDYFLVKKFLDLELPVAFISKAMNLPTSTVRSWKYGKVPSEIKKYFFDPKLVEREYAKLLKFIKREVTSNNLEYFLAMRLSEAARENLGRRRIGGRIISQILTRHFGHLNPIPEKTVSCWIDGKRKPWNAFEVLADEGRIRREYNRIIDEMTYQHLTFHISKHLAEEYGWKYSKISKELHLKKELVRGWIKKNRGSPVAKTFVNSEIVRVELKKYVDPSEKLKIIQKPDGLKSSLKKKIKKNQNTSPSKKFQKQNLDNKSELDDFDLELEQELVYHLETFPNGVTSAKVLKSILIDHNDASVEQLEKVLQRSSKIVKSRFTGKWILKQYEDEIIKERTIDEDLAEINCERDDDEVICSD